MAHTGDIGTVGAKSFAELVSGPLVDIYVGETKRHWPVHRNLLTYHSDYLQSEFQHSTPEDTPKKSKGSVDSLRLDLPDDDPVGFELLVKWLYQGKLDDVSDIVEDNDKYEHAVACQKLHQLCERFEMPKLKNMAMDQYRKGLNQARLVPDAEELNVIYRQSVDQSPFRKLMVRIAARQIMDPESDKDAESYRECFENNPGFAVDLVNAIKDGMGGRLFEDPTEKANCEYHDHDGSNCHVRGKKRLVVSRSTLSRPSQQPPPAPSTARSEDGSSPPLSPSINGFPEAHDGLAGTERPETADGNEHNDDDEEEDDFCSATSDSRSFDSAVTRILATPGGGAGESSTPARKRPRKLDRRSLAGISNPAGEPREHSEQEHGDEAKGAV